MISSRSRTNFKSADVQNIFCSNNREQRKLEGQIKRISSSARFEMNRINREMFELRKQLMENQKILGTRSDIRRRMNIDGFTSNGRVETPRLGMKDCQGNFTMARRHSIATIDNTAHEKSQHNVTGNSARFIVRKPASTSSDDTEEKKHSFNQPSSSSLTRRRRQSISVSPSYDNGLCNRREKLVVNFGQTPKEYEKEKPATSRRWSRRHSSPCPSFTDAQEKFSRKCEANSQAEVTPIIDARMKAQKIPIHDSKPLGIQTQNTEPKSVFRQRRHSTPNYMLPLNREQKDKLPLVKTRTQRPVNKITAKLPTRVASGRIRETVVGKVCQTIESKLPTKTKNGRENEGNDKESQAQNKEDNLNEVLEEQQDQKEEDDDEKEKEQEEETSGYGADEPKETVPDELCGIPKITLAEKIEKFFAGAIEFEVAAKISGHYAEVLELYLSEKGED